MQEPIDLVVATEERKKAGGLRVPTVVSLVLHVALVLWLGRSRPVEVAMQGRGGPIPRYIELMKQNPQDFVEAPGPEVEKAPITAPLSDRNRKASSPQISTDNPTTRPGDGSGLYTPPAGQAAPRVQPQVQQQPQQMAQASPQTQPSGASPSSRTLPDDVFAFREPVKASAAAPMIDWKAAASSAGRVGAQGGGDGFDLGKAGGDAGFAAEQGPLSFETQWYDWGDYAASMVSKIRVNWYANMPQLIRMGMKGVVTIRFTIHRDGRIDDIRILNTSGHPPYDLAARKAIELSSPLKSLPADFPNASERVTCMFYYNMEIPRG